MGRTFFFFSRGIRKHGVPAIQIATGSACHLDAHMVHDALHQLDGMTIDFVKTNLLNQGFEFRNPNVRDSCGCGESFSV